MLAVTCPRCDKPRNVEELAWIGSVDDDLPSVQHRLIGFECQSCDYLGVFDSYELPQSD